MARGFSCRIVAMALLALLFAGCTTGVPAPARTPDPTVPGMEPRSLAEPVAPARAVPTAGPAFHDDGQSELLAVLASLPLEFKEREYGFQTVPGGRRSLKARRS